MFSIGSYEDNMWHVISFIAGVIIIVSILIFLNVSKKIKNSKIYNSGEIEIRRKTPEEDAFAKQAAAYSFSKNETKFLKEILQSSRTEIGATLNNNKLLDDVFKIRYKELIKESEHSESALRDVTKLFEIRNTIAYFRNCEKSNGAYSQRRFLRKESSITCNCTLVKEVQEKQGNKTIKKLILTKDTFTGNILSISAGGCAISCKSKINVGVKIKIDFTIPTGPASALIGVLRVNNRKSDAVLSARFIKILPKSLAKINAFVFDYR
jgi:hypothetical protein